MLKFSKKSKKRGLPDRSATNKVVMRNQYFGDVRVGKGAPSPGEDTKFEPKKSPRRMFKRVYKLKKLTKKSFYVICLVGLMALAWWLSLISTKSYYFSGESNLNITAQYRDEFKRKASEKISKYTLLNLKTKDVEEALKKDFPDTKQVSVKRIWYKKGVEVDVQFRQPVIKWQSAGEPKYIDQDGVILSLKPIDEQNLYLINDQSGLNFNSGEKVYAQRNIIFSGQVASVIKLNGVVSASFESLSVPATSLKEIDIKLKDGPLVKLSTELDPTEQVNLLGQILTKLSSEGKKPSEYIDLRVPGKVFWK